VYTNFWLANAFNNLHAKSKYVQVDYGYRVCMWVYEWMCVV